MGLAGPKNRVKLSHDPNNTKWTNDTGGFGHKIMTSQGWQPGQYLGAKDAKHAEFHTAANASHIRVSIKDDNLGLGAKIGSGVGHGECTGLDAFKNLLGRLNGKDEDEIVKEQQSRDDLKRAIYTERRWGSIRFVQGGFLIGDKIQHLIDGEAERIRKLALGEDARSNDSSDSSSESEEEAPAPVEKAKKSKKRKIEDLEANESEVVAVKVIKSKKSRKSEATPEDEAEVAAAMKAAAKTAKRQAKKNRKAKELAEDTTDEVDVKERKREKREKKERREKKEKSGSNSDIERKESRKKKSKREKDKDSAESSVQSGATTKESTPAAPITVDTSGRSVPLMGGRHAVRARNIAQKRMASMDVASLNQIFMIKS